MVSGSTNSQADFYTIPFKVTNVGSDAFVIDEESNPTLSLTKGNTYTFNITAVGHPFWVQTSNTQYNASNIYSEGIMELQTAH